MSLFRLLPTKDAHITTLSRDGTENNRFTGSNTGHSPLLKVFAQKNEIRSGSVELARTLIKFDTTELSGKVFNEKTVPTSSIEYKLKMFDMKHDRTVPTSFDIEVYPLSRSWDEGKGIDVDDYLDFGWVNWLSASSTQEWTVTGSDYLESGYGSGSQHFDKGWEDLEIDVTEIVGNWLSSSAGNGGLPDNGLLVKLGTTEEGNGEDYFQKVFHGRETKFVDFVPYIEARWVGTVTDNRGNFAFDNDSKLYMYNFVRGELTDVTEPVFIRLQDNLIGVSASYQSEFTASKVETGTYSGSFNIASTASFSASWYDIWYSGSIVYMTGTFKPLILTGSEFDPYKQFTVDVTNLRRTYTQDDEPRIKVNVREKDYKIHVKATASFGQDRNYIEKMYFSIINDQTQETVVPFGTGSIEYTRLSYNKDGNYFDLNMQSFLPGFLYRIVFLIDYNKDKQVIDDDWVFRIV